MKVIVTFDTEKIFTKQVRDFFEKYLKREINAAEASKLLGFTQQQFQSHLAGIFAKGNSTIEVFED